MKDQQAKEDCEFEQRLRNATADRCPDCGCEKVDKFGSLEDPDDYVHCECKNKECELTWAVRPDPTKVFSTQQDKDCYFVGRKDLGYAVWMFKNKREYDRIKELNSTVIYYRKLLSQYGYDAETCEWNLKKFPVTQTDTQMEGIRLDIDTFAKAVTNLEEYKQYLAGKYNLDLAEMEHYKPCIYWLKGMSLDLGEME